MLHAEVAKLMAAMPPDVVQTMQTHEQAGTTAAPEYAAAVMAFYARHQCRIQPRPDCVETAFAKGGTEWRGTGVIADWAAPPAPALAAAWGRMPRPLPMLLLSGEHDFVTPACVAPLADSLPDAKWVLIPDASHMPHLETPEAFDAALATFWAAAEAAQQGSTAA
jgi:L-proline amide hydrolase